MLFRKVNAQMIEKCISIPLTEHVMHKEGREIVWGFCENELRRNGDLTTITSVQILRINVHLNKRCQSRITYRGKKERQKPLGICMPFEERLIVEQVLQVPHEGRRRDDDLVEQCVSERGQDAKVCAAHDDVELLDGELAWDVAMKAEESRLMDRCRTIDRLVAHPLLHADGSARRKLQAEVRNLLALVARDCTFARARKGKGGGRRLPALERTHTV